MFSGRFEGVLERLECALGSEVVFLTFLSGFGRLLGSRINQKSIPEGIKSRF